MEIKSGYVVELRDGDKYLAIETNWWGNPCIFLLGDKDYSSMASYDEDLRCDGFENLDIVKVWGEPCRYVLEDVVKDTWFNYSPLWVRPKEMTKKEIEEALGYEIKIVEEE